MDIIHDLRKGKFDVLIGINLLREGLDIPEVSLVAILDADKEGFLRSTRSLIQTSGRASRNIRGQVIMYADFVTRSMKKAIDETDRRRKIQKIYNKKYGITPKSIEKDITSIFGEMYKNNDEQKDMVSEAVAQYDSLEDLDDIIKDMEAQMEQAAKELAFERASELRDQIKALKKMIVFEL
jgi:excinuclease ABC subunit B